MRRSGFTLVEVMVAAGLVSLVAIGVLTVIISFARNTSRFAAREDLNELNKVLQLIFTNDSISCDRVITGASGAPLDFIPPEIQVNSVYNPGGTLTPLVQSGTTVGRLQIGQMTLVKSDGVEPPRQETIALTDRTTGTVVQQNYTIYRANLVVPASTPNQDPTGSRQSFAPVVIPLRIYTLTNSGPRIVRCDLASATSQTCSAMGGTFDPAQGRCVFPLCNQALITQQAARIGRDYSCQHGTDCSADLYFWGFQADQSQQTLPVCVCTNSCTRSGGGY